MRKITNKILLVLLTLLVVSCEVEINFGFNKNTFDEQKALWNEYADYINYSYIYIASKPGEDGADEICEMYEIYVKDGVASYIDLLSDNREKKKDNAERFKIENIYERTENFYYEHKDDSFLMCEAECSPNYSFYSGIDIDFDYTRHIPVLILYVLSSTTNKLISPESAILFRIENFQVFS